MHVFCCGMSRSGGTLQYQLTKELVERKGLGKGGGEVHYATSIESSGSGFVVVKTEPCQDWKAAAVRTGAAKAVNIYRDCRDVVVSLMRFFRLQREWIPKHPRSPKFDAITADCHIIALDNQVKWESLPGIHSSRYEDFWPDKWHEEVMRIAEHLNISISEKEAKEIAAEYSVVKNIERMAKVDGWWQPRRTLLTRGHISSRQGEPGTWKNVLTPEQVMIVERIAGDWLVSHGYELTMPRDSDSDG